MSEPQEHPHFVIRSSPRTGSHMLATALDGHSQLSVTGEAFLRPEVYDIEPGDTIAGCLDHILAVTTASSNTAGFPCGTREGHASVTRPAIISGRRSPVERS